MGAAQRHHVQCAVGFPKRAELAETVANNVLGVAHEGLPQRVNAVRCAGPDSG